MKVKHIKRKHKRNRPSHRKEFLFIVSSGLGVWRYVFRGKTRWQAYKRCQAYRDIETYPSRKCELNSSQYLVRKQQYRAYDGKPLFTESEIKEMLS